MSPMLRKLPLIVFTAALAALTMGQESCSELEKEEPTVEKRGGGSADAKGAGVGDRVTLKGTAYRVTDVERAQTVGDNQFTRVKANGTFVIVRLKLTNTEDEPATISEDNIRLIGGNGKNYSTSDDAILALDDQPLIFEEIQPDVTEKGAFVYDLPPAAVSGAKLRVEDFWSESTADIDLGL